MFQFISCLLWCVLVLVYSRFKYVFNYPPIRGMWSDFQFFNLVLECNLLILYVGGSSSHLFYQIVTMANSPGRSSPQRAVSGISEHIYDGFNVHGMFKPLYQRSLVQILHPSRILSNFKN